MHISFTLDKKTFYEGLYTPLKKTKMHTFWEMKRTKTPGQGKKNKRTLGRK